MNTQGLTFAIAAGAITLEDGTVLAFASGEHDAGQCELTVTRPDGHADRVTFNRNGNMTGMVSDEPRGERVRPDEGKPARKTQDVHAQPARDKQEEERQRVGHGKVNTTEELRRGKKDEGGEKKKGV